MQLCEPLVEGLGASRLQGPALGGEGRSQLEREVLAWLALQLCRDLPGTGLQAQLALRAVARGRALAREAQRDARVLSQGAAQTAPHRAREQGVHHERQSAAVAGDGGPLLHREVGRQRSDYADIRLWCHACDVDPGPDGGRGAQARGGRQEELRGTGAVCPLDVRGAPQRELEQLARDNLHTMRCRGILQSPAPPQVSSMGARSCDSRQGQGAVQTQESLHLELFVAAEELPDAALQVSQAVLRQAQLTGVRPAALVVRKALG
mmetsp:Transcript_105805/g.316025  ORF Transcript_105805/g.316025 Transcript_105805/m.316025 type:complete len:264 (+) Transcript_105805:660-1451(+)